MAITDWKDATGRSLPGALGYFLLTGQIAIPTADSADEGLNPDLIEPLGSIVLHPLQTETRFIGTADADPLTIALVDIPIKMNRAGQLFVIDGEAGARILNTSDPHLNPANIPYEVRFEFEDIDETVKPRIAPFTILPPPPRTDGEPWVLDITQLATVAVTGQPVSVEMARALVAAGWEATRTVLAAADQMKATTQEAKTAAENAAASAQAAATSAQNAEESASTATASANVSEAKATEAATSAQAAKESADVSAAKASEAATSATAAQESADTSEAKATEAATSASQSAASAQVSETKATEAATSASAAQRSADTSEAKATEAAASANVSEAKATEAATSAASAKESADTAEAKVATAEGYVKQVNEALAAGMFDFEINHDLGRIRLKAKGATEWSEWLALPKGDTGRGIKTVTVSPAGHLLVTYDDQPDTPVDCGVARTEYTMRVDQTDGNLYYRDNLGGAEKKAGQVRGNDGQPPILEAGEMTASTDGSYGIEVAQTGERKYAINLHMPPPAGISEEVVQSMVDKTVKNLKLLAMAGL